MKNTSENKMADEIARRIRTLGTMMTKSEHGLVMKYFVLKPAGDDAYASASRRAMFAYAKAIMEENPELSKQMWDWAGDENIAHHERMGTLPGEESP